MVGKTLVVTTISDKSSGLLNENFSGDVILYEETEKLIVEGSLKNDYKYVYFRDPFNTKSYDIKAIKLAVDLVRVNNSSAYFVDGVKTFDDLLQEDKWLQYLVFHEFMPMTNLLSGVGDFIKASHIIKKRISSRARGVHFEYIPEYSDGNYIVQEMMEIVKEYRVYCIGNNIINTVCVKSPKTALQKVKILEVEKISKDLELFSENIRPYTKKLDFYGLDIARLDDGSLRLIEINRSPQFAKFQGLSGLNLAKDFISYLYNK
jgi:ATP-grasp domain, R2K clade family 3